MLGRYLENCKDSKGLITGGVVAGKIIENPQPAYAGIARSAHASGEVVVMVIVDEEGKVIAAQVSSGHPLLRPACIKAAKETRFTPTLREGKPIKVLGAITYKFVHQ